VARQLEPVKVLIDAMLSEDLQAPRKQRHTVRRIFARLADEHGFSGASYSTVRDYVRVRRAEIEAGAGRGPEVFVPQEHAPGAEAEVDFGDVWVDLARRPDQMLYVRFPALPFRQNDPQGLSLH
jgi:hypothetical protein